MQELKVRCHECRKAQEHVVAYYSRALSKAERNYCITWLELLATVKALDHFHKYLYWEEFELHTDLAPDPKG
jgi:hypothetical protein